MGPHPLRSEEHVAGADDPRLALYRDVRDPELLRRHGAFVAEGRLVVRRLLTASRFRARSVLVTPTARAELADVLDALGPEVPVYVARPDVFHALTGFNVHRGCLAIGERERPAASCADGSATSAPNSSWRDVVRDARIVVLLENVGNPDNVGGVFRNAAALGADAVLLSPGCSDPLYRKSIRTSMGAALTLPFAAAAPWPDVLDDLRAAGFAVVALTPSPAARDIDDLAGPARPPRVALLIGHEGDGTSREALALADGRVRIPMTPGADSLNVATAAAIALHRLASDAERALRSLRAGHAE